MRAHACTCAHSSSMQRTMPSPTCNSMHACLRKQKTTLCFMQPCGDGLRQPLSGQCNDNCNAPTESLTQSSCFLHLRSGLGRALNTLPTSSRPVSARSKNESRGNESVISRHAQQCVPSRVGSPWPATLLAAHASKSHRSACVAAILPRPGQGGRTRAGDAAKFVYPRVRWPPAVPTDSHEMQRGVHLQRHRMHSL